MPNSLQPDLITRIKPLLLPYVRDKDEREALFIETYFLRDPRPLDLINFEGSSDVFATRCIADLIKKIGCLAEDGDRQHALAALLLTIRARCSVEHYAAIDHWLSLLNDQCLTPTVELAKPEPVTAPAQTIDTPADERSASVFISYSHANEAFATQLMADLGGAGHRCWIDTSKIKGGADWQRAARGTDGRKYPYLGHYDPTKGNTVHTRIMQTSAVGIFPNGASSVGALDMSGNVREWCLNEYHNPENISVNGTKPRILRGGSWRSLEDLARTTSRKGYDFPKIRDHHSGFRLVCVVASHSSNH